MLQGQAEQLAGEALLWMAARPEILGRFLNESGLDVTELRRRAGEAELMGFLLDFLLADEALLLDVASGMAVDPALFAQARAALPGGDAPFWT